MTEIGGYFNLELRLKDSFLHSDGVLLNTCRNALEYVLLSIGEISKLWIPFYTCDSVIEPIKRLHIKYEFYSINKKLEIEIPIHLKENEYLIYNNYFGIKDHYINQLISVYGKYLIVDNAQSFYSDIHFGVSTVYSPRKFFGVPDGGIAFTYKALDKTIEQDKSYNRCRHLLKRYDEGASAGYKDFTQVEESLSEQEIMKMSQLTMSLLKSIDYEEARSRRLSNFRFLHNALSSRNLIDIKISDMSVPMVYPFFTKEKGLRAKLLSNNIYVATYWPNVLKWCDEKQFEFELATNILPLPIDQRYGEVEMITIINSII